MQESEWLRIDPAKFNPPRRELIRGVEVSVLFSPHDVPEALRGFYHDGVRKFVIEFRYLDEEPFRRKTVDDHLIARIGKHSGRLHGFEIDVNALRAGAVSLEVRVPQLLRGAIERMRADPSRKRRHDNLEVAESVLTDNRDQVLHELGV